MTEGKLHPSSLLRDFNASNYPVEQSPHRYGYALCPFIYLLHISLETDLLHHYRKNEPFDTEDAKRGLGTGSKWFG